MSNIRKIELNKDCSIHLIKIGLVSGDYLLVQISIHVNYSTVTRKMGN